MSDPSTRGSAAEPATPDHRGVGLQAAVALAVAGALSWLALWGWRVVAWGPEAPAEAGVLWLVALAGGVVLQFGVPVAGVWLATRPRLDRVRMGLGALTVWGLLGVPDLAVVVGTLLHGAGVPFLLDVVVHGLVPVAGLVAALVALRGAGAGARVGGGWTLVAAVAVAVWAVGVLLPAQADAAAGGAVTVATGLTGAGGTPSPGQAPVLFVAEVVAVVVLVGLAVAVWRWHGEVAGGATAALAIHALVFVAVTAAGFVASPVGMEPASPHPAVAVHVVAAVMLSVAAAQLVRAR